MKSVMAEERVRICGEKSLTLAHPSVTTRLTFVHLSDLQLWMPGRGLTAEEREMLRSYGIARSLGETDDMMLALVDKINNCSPDLVLISGDLIDFFEPLSLEFAAYVLKRFRAPVYFTLGNHDVARFEPPDRWINSYESEAEKIREAWKKRFNMDSVSYCFTYQGIRFIALDTSESKIGSADLCWFRNLILSDDETPTILFYHVPAPIPTLLPEVAQHRKVYYCLKQDQNTLEFMHILEESKCIIATFCGHVHFNSAHWCGSVLQTTIYPSCDGGIRWVSLVKEI